MGAGHQKAYNCIVLAQNDPHDVEVAMKYVLPLVVLTTACAPRPADKSCSSNRKRRPTANHRRGKLRDNLMRPARRSAPAQRAKLARNPPRQCPVASVTSIERKPAAARRAQYSAMPGSRLARGTWPNSDRIVIGNNISDMASDPPGFSTR